jgi:hypothetical protein
VGPGRRGQARQQAGPEQQGAGPGGIALSARGHLLALFGADAGTPGDPNATRYAVTTFLEDKLGVRYLWPGELGKVVPGRGTIIVGDFEHRFTPPLAQRRIRDMGYHDRIQVGLDRLGFTKEGYERLRAGAQRTEAASPDWFGWHRLGGSLNLKGGHAFGHLWARYGKAHPDWFGLQADGSRDQSRSPDRARLCKSNAGLIAARMVYFWSVRRYFDRLEALMNEAAARKGKAAAAFGPEAIAALRKELGRARKEAGGAAAIVKRVAFLELGLRWAEVEARAHSFLSDPAKADRKAAGKVLDERLALMKEVFVKGPLAVNVAYVSWGEDALWARLGWGRPGPGGKP